jgi:hypothetical protein
MSSDAWYVWSFRTTRFWKMPWRAAFSRKSPMRMSQKPPRYPSAT